MTTNLAEMLSTDADQAVLARLRRARPMMMRIAQFMGQLLSAAQRLATPQTGVAGIEVVSRDSYSFALVFCEREVLFAGQYDGSDLGGTLRVGIRQSDGSVRHVGGLQFNAYNGITDLRIRPLPGLETSVSLDDDGDCYALIARCLDLALKCSWQSSIQSAAT